MTKSQVTCQKTLAEWIQKKNNMFYMSLFCINSLNLFSFIKNGKQNTRSNNTYHISRDSGNVGAIGKHHIYDIYVRQ